MRIRDEDLEEVMGDLVALAEAGEASQATERLVAEYRRERPGFSAEAADRLDLAPPPAVRRDEELAALKRTREFVRLRSVFMGVGIAFTSLPLSFRFGTGGFRMLFFPEQTGLIAGCWSIAAASWVAMYVMNRKVRAKGL